MTLKPIAQPIDGLWKSGKNLFKLLLVDRHYYGDWQVDFDERIWATSQDRYIEEMRINGAEFGVVRYEPVEGSPFHDDRPLLSMWMVPVLPNYRATIYPFEKLFDDHIFVGLYRVRIQ